jgi:hypothetical protein
MRANRIAFTTTSPLEQTKPRVATLPFVLSFADVVVHFKLPSRPSVPTVRVPRSQLISRA